MFIVLLECQHLKHAHLSLFRATLIQLVWMLVLIQFNWINVPKAKIFSLLSNNHNVETSLFNLILSLTFIQLYSPLRSSTVQLDKKKTKTNHSDPYWRCWKRMHQIDMCCNTQKNGDTSLLGCCPHILCVKIQWPDQTARLRSLIWSFSLRRGTVLMYNLLQWCLIDSDWIHRRYFKVNKKDRQ